MHFQIKYFEKQLLSQYQICSWCTSIKHERCIFELKKKKKDSSDVLKSSRLSKIFIEAKFSNLRPFIFFIETCIPCNFNHSDIFLVEKHSSLSDIRE